MARSPGAAYKIPLVDDVQSLSFLKHRVDFGLPHVNSSAPNQTESFYIAFDVDGEGNVQNVEGIGSPALLETVKRAVKQWKYEPYVVDGKIVPLWKSYMQIVITTNK
jgi:hypothetical protein